MGYRARRFEPDADREALLALWQGNLSDRSLAPRLEARYRWLYESHPLHALRTFLVVDETSGAVVECSSLVPHTVSVDGVLVPAAIGVDLATAAGHRVAGPAVTMQRAAVEAVGQGLLGAGAFSFAYPNDGALPVVKRVGYKVVAKTSHAVKPVRTAYKLRAKLRVDALVAPAALAGDFVLRALDWARLAAARGGDRPEVVAVPDGRFDRLYDTVRERVPILGDRRSDFLTWRYVSCPTKAYTIFALFDHRTDDLRAYAIYAIDGRTAIIADALATDDRVLTTLFVRLAIHLRDGPVDSLFASFAGDEALARALVGAGFFPRGEDRTFVLFVPPSVPEARRSKLASGAGWRIFDGELDI